MLDLIRLLDGSVPCVNFDLCLNMSGISDDIVSGEAHAFGVITNRSGCIELSGQIAACMNVICARCAREFCENDIYGLYAKIAESLANEDEDEFLLLENAKLDIEGYVRSNLILCLPSRFLCSDDCKGLCPVCGCDLNESSCTCEKDGHDPRWKALESFFEEE